MSSYSRKGGDLSQHHQRRGNLYDITINFFGRALSCGGERDLEGGKDEKN